MKKSNPSVLDHIKRYEKLKGERTNWDQHWDEVSRLVHPNFDDVFKSRIAGEKKGLEVFDNTPTHSNQLLASALHGMLTNPASYWFGLKTGNPVIDNIDPVRRWLQSASIAIHDKLNSTNFQTEMIEVYLGLGAIGTWVLYMEEDDDRVVNFSARPIYQTYVCENKRGEIDEIYRTEKWKKYQIFEKFDKEKVELKKDQVDWREKLKRKDDNEDIEILHVVYPRREYDNSLLPAKFKFGSEYIWLEERLPLSISGYREFPYAVPRWSKVSGEVYGRSPAMNCLADIKMLQVIMKTQIKGLQKTVDPPILSPDEGVVRPLKLIPGGIVYYRAGTQDQIKPLQTDSRVDFGQKALEDLRGRIQRSFYIDQLQLKDGPQMTATEVQRRTEQQLRLMGPILGRLHHELIRPIVDRVFAIMLRRGMLPQPIPGELSKQKLQIQFSSLIAKAQRASQADDVTRALSIMTPIFQAQPQTLDNIDGDNAVRNIAKILDLPEEMIKDEADRDKERGARAQAQQQAAAMQQQMNQAQMVRDAGPSAIEAARLAGEQEGGEAGQ